jgi:hypothetical protein
MPPKRVSQCLHPDEAPPQESTNPAQPNQPSTQILPTIVEGQEHPTFRNTPELQLHQPTHASTNQPTHPPSTNQPTHASTTIVGPSQTNDTATSSQTSTGLHANHPYENLCQYTCFQETHNSTRSKSMIGMKKQRKKKLQQKRKR